MNWAQMEGKWNDVKGRAKERWGRLTDDDLTRVEGKQDRLVGLIQQKYGIARDKAEHEVTDWASSAQSMFERAKDTMQQTEHQGVEQARQGFDQAKDTVTDAVQKGREYIANSNMSDMAGDLRDLIGKHPIPAAIIGLGVGYVLGRLASSSRS